MEKQTNNVSNVQGASDREKGTLQEVLQKKSQDDNYNHDDILEKHFNPYQVVIGQEACNHPMLEVIH